jgi:hypothetical protein
MTSKHGPEAPDSPATVGLVAIHDFHGNIEQHQSVPVTRSDDRANSFSGFLRQRDAEISMRDIEALEAWLKALPPWPVPPGMGYRDLRPDVTPPAPQAMNSQALQASGPWGANPAPSGHPGAARPMTLNSVPIPSGSTSRLHASAIA